MTPSFSARLAVLGAAGILFCCACSSMDPGGPAHGREITPASDSTSAPPPPSDNGTTTPPSSPPAADASAGPTPDAAAPPDAGGPASPIQSFTLLDTSQTGAVMGTAVTGFDPIPAKATISLGQVATLSIRANLGGNTVGSISFAYNGINHTENGAPYVLCGDDGAGTITNCNLTAGTLQLTATPYSDANLGGTALTPRTVTIDITP